MITVMSLCRNEFPMLKWYLRCYEMIADEILIWDDNSDDGSRELLRSHPLVKLYDCPWSGINEDASLHHFYSMLATRRGYGWTIVVDIDEIIIGQTSDWMKIKMAESDGEFEVVRTAGYNMFTEFTYNACLPSPRDEFPYEQKQLWQIHPNGVYSSCYSKPIVVRYGCRPKWTRGRHQLEKCNLKRSEQPLLKLLHYGFRHPSFVTSKNANNLARCTDKSYGWTCQPDYKGVHSPEWVESEMKKSVNVVEAPMPNVTIDDEKVLP